MLFYLSHLYGISLPTVREYSYTQIPEQDSGFNHQEQEIHVIYLRLTLPLAIWRISTFSLKL